MDPLTQGTLGAALPQALRPIATPNPSPHIRIAGGLGFLSGMAADLDVFINSATDPLLFLEYHRHFTHSLFFIPFGGLLCALVLYKLFGRHWRLTVGQTFIFCTLGYATHAVLDACTSYGTMLLWPFSDVRISWSIVAVIDPLFTLPLLGLALTSWLRENPLYARLGLGWAALYLAWGITQHLTAINMTQELAAARGHTPTRLEVKPSFGNTLVWKTIYETPDAFYVDAARTGFAPRVFEGTSVPTLNLARDLPWLAADSQQGKDLARFSWFSQDFVALDPRAPNRVMDVRYSLVPNDVTPLWYIALSPDAGPAEHARYVAKREDVRGSADRLWQMMWE